MANAKGFMLRMSPEIHHKITTAAKANSRSINAEINERLKGSFMTGVFGRLDWLFCFLRGEQSKSFTLSILAEAIGEETSCRLERVFAGLEDPTFKLLDALAKHCKVNSAWLKHGTGQPFEAVSGLARLKAAGEALAQEKMKKSPFNDGDIR